MTSSQIIEKFCNSFHKIVYVCYSDTSILKILTVYLLLSLLHTISASNPETYTCGTPASHFKTYSHLWATEVVRHDASRMTQTEHPALTSDAALSVVGKECSTASH